MDQDYYNEDGKMPDATLQVPLCIKHVGCLVSTAADNVPINSFAQVRKVLHQPSNSKNDASLFYGQTILRCASAICDLIPRLIIILADSNDESLQRYKESLGLGGGKDLSDPNDKRVCIIRKLSMESPGREPVTIDLSAPGSETTLKDKPFKIKEGSKFTMVAEFKVQHEILSGLQYVQIVKRKGIKVSKDSEMLVSCFDHYYLLVTIY